MGIKQNRNHAFILAGMLSGEKLQRQIHRTHDEMYRELTHAQYYSNDALWHSMLPLKNKLSGVFEQEELLMEQHIYPRQKKHRHEHQLFLFLFNELYILCREKNSIRENPYQQWRHLYWLCDWLKNHIQWSDHFFYHYLRLKINTAAHARFSDVLQWQTEQSGIFTEAIRNYSAEYVILRSKVL